MAGETFYDRTRSIDGNAPNVFHRRRFCRFNLLFGVGELRCETLLQFLAAGFGLRSELLMSLCGKRMSVALKLERSQKLFSEERKWSESDVVSTKITALTAVPVIPPAPAPPAPPAPAPPPQPGPAKK